MIDEKELDLFCEEYPELTREEIIEILEIMEECYGEHDD